MRMTAPAERPSTRCRAGDARPPFPGFGASGRTVPMQLIPSSSQAVSRINLVLCVGCHLFSNKLISLGRVPQMSCHSPKKLIKLRYCLILSMIGQLYHSKQKRGNISPISRKYSPFSRKQIITSLYLLDFLMEREIYPHIEDDFTHFLEEMLVRIVSFY